MASRSRARRPTACARERVDNVEQLRFETAGMFQGQRHGHRLSYHAVVEKGY